MSAHPSKTGDARRYARDIVRMIPPPQFLELGAVGIDISDTHIRMVCLERSSYGFEVKKFESAALPPGALMNGEIQDADKVKEILKQIAEKYSLHFVRVSLPEEKAFLFKTTIPRVPKKEVRGAVIFRLEENVPLALSDAVFDYSIVDSTDAHGDHFDVEVAVLPKETVEKYTSVLAESGLEPVSFLIEPQAIMRSVIRRGDMSTALIVNIEPEKTGLYIVSEEIVHFTSTINLGGSLITSVLEKSLKVPRAEAERVKRREGLEGHRENEDLFFAIMSPIAALKDEIRKVISYWQTHEGEKHEEGRNIEKLILCGKDSSIPGLETYLSQTIKKKIEIADIWQNAFSLDHAIPDITKDESLDYAAAVGAALPRH